MDYIAALHRESVDVPSGGETLDLVGVHSPFVLVDIISATHWDPARPTAPAQLAVNLSSDTTHLTIRIPRSSQVGVAISGKADLELSVRGTKRNERPRVVLEDTQLKSLTAERVEVVVLALPTGPRSQRGTISSVELESAALDISTRNINQLGMAKNSHVSLQLCNVGTLTVKDSGQSTVSTTACRIGTLRPRQEQLAEMGSPY
jgi:hypothetical protein